MFVDEDQSVTPAIEGVEWFKTDARFLENYRVQSPALGWAVASAKNRRGDVELFVLDAANRLINYTPDPTSDTGWGRIDMGFSVPNSKTVIEAGQTAEGSLIVFVQSGSDLFYIEDDPGVGHRWGAAKKLAANMGMPTQIRCAKIGGQLYVGVTTEPDKGGLWISAVQWDSKSPSLGRVQTFPTAPKTGPRIGWTAGTDIGGVQLLFTLGDAINGLKPGPGVAAAAASVVGSAAAAAQIGTGTVNSFAVVDDSNGRPKMFGVLEDGNLYFMDGSTRPWQWRQISAPERLNGVKLSSVRASADPDGVLEVFAFANGPRSPIYHLKQDGTTSNGFTDLLDLGIPVVAYNFTVSRNAEGFLEGFGAAPDGAVFRLGFEPTTQDWDMETIEVEVGGDVEPVVTYTTEITVLDEGQQPSPHQAVKIWADDLALLTINGETVWVDKARPYVGESNAAGQVTVTAPTDALSTPLLKIWSGWMDPGESVVIEPNLETQDRLRNIQGDEMMRDTVDGKPLLPDNARNQETADYVAETIRNSMTLVAPTIEGAPTIANVLGQRSARPMMQRVQGPNAQFSRAIQVDAVPEQSWKVDFSGDTPVFSTLTHEQATAQMAAANSSLQAYSGFLGFSWGDVWQAVKRGVGKVVSLVVDVAGKAIKSLLTVLIDGFSYVYNATITLIEQAFDIVEGVLEKVGIPFPKIFKWLGFIFNWNDIRLTRDAIEHTFNEGFDVLVGSLEYVKTHVDQIFNGLDTSIENAFQQVIDKVGGASLLSSERQNPPDKNFDHSVSNNVVQTGYLNHASGGTPAETTAMTAMAGSALNELDQAMQALTNDANTLSASDDFKQANQYFANAVNNVRKDPDQALRLLFAGILGTLKAVARLGLRLVKDAIVSIVSALQSFAAQLKQMLNAKWNIPFISALYRYITGGDLSALGVLSLIAAVPTTIFYKIYYSAAPLKTKDDVQTFKAKFTAKAILDASGMSGSGGPEAAAATENKLAVALSGNWIQLIGVVNMFSTWTMGILNGACDVIPVNAPPEKVQDTLSATSMIASVISWITACPYLSDKKLVEAPGDTNPGRIGALYWVLGATGFATDAVFYLVSKIKTKIGRKKALSGSIGNVLNFLVGLEMVGMSVAVGVVQSRSNEYSAGAMTANLCSAIPTVFGITRLIVSPWVQVALAAIDVCGNAVSGILNFVLLQNVIHAPGRDDGLRGDLESPALRPA